MDQLMSIKRDIEKRKTPSGEIEGGVRRKMRADYLAHATGYLLNCAGEHRRRDASAHRKVHPASTLERTASTRLRVGRNGRPHIHLSGTVTGNSLSGCWLRTTASIAVPTYLRWKRPTSYTRMSMPQLRGCSISRKLVRDFRTCTKSPDGNEAKVITQYTPRLSVARTT